MYFANQDQVAPLLSSDDANISDHDRSDVDDQNNDNDDRSDDVPVEQRGTKNLRDQLCSNC